MDARQIATREGSTNGSASERLKKADNGKLAETARNGTSPEDTAQRDWQGD